MKVAIYCRLSDEDRDKKSKGDDSESIQNQKSMLIDYAMKQQWEIYNIYSDDDYTGADRNRPEFNKLLAEARRRKFDIVLCKTQSRFTRELELVEKYIHDLFPAWGIRFVSIVDNADTAVKGNKKARQINGLINEWYLEDLSENIKSVLTNRREKGLHIGSFALYGYMKDPGQKGHLIIDEEAATTVREVFTLFANGMGKTAIARYLNDKGIPNPTEYKRQYGLRYKQPPHKNSTLWKYAAVSHMLTNEDYIGHMVQGRAYSVSYKTKINKPVPKGQWIRVENMHEPIISMELWDRVQALIKQKAKPFDTGKIGIFAKKVKCLHCGYNMRTSKHHEDRYLRCESRFFSKNACPGSMILVRKLEEVVLSELQDLMKRYLDKDWLEQNTTFQSHITKKKEPFLQDIAMYQEKIAVCTKGVKNLYLDKTKGLITDDEFVELSKDFHADKARYAACIAEAEEQLSALEGKQEQATSLREMIDQYTDIHSLTRDMVVELIDYIEVGHRYEKSRERPIKIHWNF